MTSIKAAPVLDHSAEALVIPRAAAVIRSFRITPVEHPVLTPAAGLATQRRLQVEAHRVVSDPNAADHVVAAAARSVNAANVACAVLIDRIDVWAAKALAECRAVVVHTESLGQLVDRLAILWMRCQVVDADDNSTGRRVAYHQLGELVVAYDDLIADLANGRRRLPIYQTPTGPNQAA